MQGDKGKLMLLKLLIAMVFAAGVAFGQPGYKTVPLPPALRNINEEFSGMAQLGNRIYLLPQYGGFYESKLDGDFNMYSLLADSINSVIQGKDTSLTHFNILKIHNLEKLPQVIKNAYQGFETLTFLGNTVYMAIETVDTAANCYLVKGIIDTLKREINIDYKNYLALKRPFYIGNAGYESIAWAPGANKLIAFYEFNASPGGNMAYLIDTTLTKAPEPVRTPFLYFRNTDAVTATNGSIYAINYFWDGDYDKYLNNGLVQNAENDIKRAVPSLRDILDKHPDYLKSHTFARIVYLKNNRKKKWKQVAAFDGYKKNWEGITLFNKGALVITDANRSTKQVTVLAYIAF